MQRYRRGQAMSGSAGLPGVVDTCAYRQIPAQTPVDVRVNSDHIPFTPLPSSEGAPGWC